jgi:hypothetical protein
MKNLILAFALCFCTLTAFAQMLPNATVIPVAPIALTAATYNSVDQTNTNWKGGHFVVNVSNYNGGTYTVHIQGEDPVSGGYYDILVSAGITASGITVLKVYPGITAASNVSVSDVLPKIWRVQLIGTSTPSMTISVGAYLEN